MNGNVLFLKVNKSSITLKYGEMINKGKGEFSFINGIDS